MRDGVQQQRVCDRLQHDDAIKSPVGYSSRKGEKSVCKEEHGCDVWKSGMQNEAVETGRGWGSTYRQLEVFGQTGPRPYLGVRRREAWVSIRYYFEAVCVVIRAGRRTRQRAEISGAPLQMQPLLAFWL